jgi:hypothetical protein
VLSEETSRDFISFLVAQASVSCLIALDLYLDSLKGRDFVFSLCQSLMVVYESRHKELSQLLIPVNVHTVKYLILIFMQTNMQYY